MPVRISQTKTGTSTLASTIITWTNNTVSGNFLVAAVATNLTTDVSGVSDTQGNLWVKAFAAVGTGVGSELWYSSNILGGITPTVTVAYTSGATASVVIQEYSGIDTVTVLDRTSTNSGNSNTLDSLSTTRTNQQLELLIGVGGAVSATFTAGGSFVNLTQQGNATIDVAIEDLFVTSTGTYNATFGASGSIQWACGIATFRLLPQGTTTSTSSTSISSTSVSSTSFSSTSSSVSTSSTSTSATTFSTSSTSSSTSLSSTSSSISSTSSSTSSTSISSTSSSTSISSTSSSISSTSTSSTSISSTSTSISISSTSSSISSTSSSISSTSVSTSSTSFSSTSSSSSTSTTTFPPPFIDFDAQDSLVLATSGADLLSDLNAYQASNLSGDDGDYFIQRGSEYTALHFQRIATSNTQNINIIWKGRSTESSIISPVYLQIFNQNSAQWETLDYDNTKVADVDYILNGSVTTNLSNYYDSNFQVTCRIYQQVI